MTPTARTPTAEDRIAAAQVRLATAVTPCPHCGVTGGLRIKQTRYGERRGHCSNCKRSRIPIDLSECIRRIHSALVSCK